MSKGRLVVTYSDGCWTDRLSIERYGLRNESEGLILRIQVKPVVRLPRGWRTGKAITELVTKRNAVHTIQIGAPEIVGALRSKIRAQEHSRLGLCIRAAGKETLYPVAAVFGPDEMTLHIGWPRPSEPIGHTIFTAS